MSTTLNYPITTPQAMAFWASNHKCNRLKCIIAFSLDLKNANDNLRRYGYPYQLRKRALSSFGLYVNTPGMETIPFSQANAPWWSELKVVITKEKERWKDNPRWVGTDKWVSDK